MGTQSLFLIVFLLSLLHSTVFVSSQLSATQKSSMINLFELLQYQIDYYAEDLRWDVNTDPCSWDGVTCNSVENAVTRLDLSYFGFYNSSFISIACEIDSLEVLDTSYNKLVSIPDEFVTSCGKLPKLKEMYFHWNNISGDLPAFNRGFTKLESLDLSHNSLSGSIGRQLDGLVALKSLNLASNNFTGSIPTSLEKAKNLTILYLSSNRLVLIPDEFVTSCGKLPKLKEIDFHWNNITGDLPAFNKGFTKLESLDLSHNSLSGSIGRQLHGLVALKSLNLASNNFTGSISTSLLGKGNGLEKLDLSRNNLQGRIPNDLLSLPKLQTVDLSYNMLVGTIPEKISSSLVNLILGVNSLLYGSILLINFGMLENLVQLDLSNNRLSGNIPADIGLCQKLRSLDLSENQLSGILPKQLGNLKRLQVLNLQLNHFVGKIPREITLLSNLKSLDISSNSFSGSIPSSISNLTNLQYLNMQDNYLSGTIPRNMGITNFMLYEVQLGNNHLSGEIPPMPLTLQTLNLSNNLLEGQIPASFLEFLNILILSNNRISGSIPNISTDGSDLTELDLSNNQLSGSIPSQPGFFRQLNSLNLSYNLLSGPIPPLLQRFRYESFIGNFDLCGKPLTINCHESNRNFYIGLYVSIGLGFYLGFWGVCGTLVLKDAWRHAYFNFVDNIYNKIYVTVAIYVARFKRNTQT